MIVLIHQILKLNLTSSIYPVTFNAPIFSCCMLFKMQPVTFIKKLHVNSIANYNNLKFQAIYFANLMPETDKSKPLLKVKLIQSVGHPLNPIAKRLYCVLVNTSQFIGCCQTICIITTTHSQP